MPQNPEYLRGLAFSLVEFFGAIMAWRGLWDWTEDIWPGAAATSPTLPWGSSLMGILFAASNLDASTPSQACSLLTTF